MNRLPLFLTLTLYACIPDDWDPNDTDRVDDSADPTETDSGEDSGETGEPSAPDPQLVGRWRSDGSDLSRLFQRLDIVWVEADFRASGTYTVTSQDEAGQRGTFSGTWTVDRGGDPPGITLDQTAPYAGRAEGLYRVDGDTLTFETVQTLPDYGNTPPQGDFGTSRGTGLSPGDNVQTYVRP